MWLLNISGLRQHWNKTLFPFYSCCWWAAMVKWEDKRQSYELNTKRALGWHQHGVEGTGWVEALRMQHQDAALFEDWAVPWHHHHLPHGIQEDQACCWHRHTAGGSNAAGGQCWQRWQRRGWHLRDCIKKMCFLETELMHVRPGSSQDNAGITQHYQHLLFPIHFPLPS